MALDTYSAILGWLNQGTGNNNNNWGELCDTAIFPIFESAIAGLSSHSVTGGTLVLSASPPPAGPTGALEMIQAFSGTLTSDQVVQVPNLTKLWLVYNNTSGSFTLKFKTPSGTASAAIPQGGWAFVFCDGGDGIYVGLSTSLRDVQFLGPNGTIALPGISFASQPSLGLRRVSSGVMALTVGGVDVLTISATGVDVGTGLALSIGGASVVPPGTEVNTTAIRAPTGWYFEYGQAVTRAGDPSLLAAITEGFTANTNGTVTLSNVSKDLRNLGLEGSTLEGTGIFTGATIVSVDSATQITMSAAATNTATGGAVTAFPYGNGDGSTTFTLPDARGTVAAGRDNMGGTAASKLTTAGSGVNGLKLNTVAGAQNITLDATQIPAHTHPNSLNDPGHTHSLQSGLYVFNGGPVGLTGGAQPGGTTANTSTGSATTGITITNAANTGGGGAHANVQPTRIRNVIIKR